MLARIVLLFLLLPAIEFVLFIQVEKLIDFWPTVALILVTGVVGGYLARREGASTWKKLNARLSQGGLPGNEIVEGVIILVAGALLVTPGVLTDVVGFLGLLPPTRHMIRRLVVKRFKHKLETGSMSVQYGVGFGSGGFSAGSTSNFDDDSPEEPVHQKRQVSAPPTGKGRAARSPGMRRKSTSRPRDPSHAMVSNTNRPAPCRMSALPCPRHSADWSTS